MPITIEKCGTAIAWVFNTEPKGIAFGIVYKPTSESSREDEVRTYMYMCAVNVTRPYFEGNRTL